MNPMETNGGEGSVVVFHVHQRKDIRKKTTRKHINCGETGIQ